MDLTPRPTLYRGIQMRSRLEARFARSLDQAGVGWAYERDCFAAPAGEYLPDFCLRIPYFPHGDTQARTVYVEVKPVSSALADLDRWETIIQESRPAARLIGWAADSPMRFAGTAGSDPHLVACCDCAAIAMVCGCCRQGDGDAGPCGCGRGHRHPVLFVFLTSEPLGDRAPALGSFRRHA